MQANLDSYMLSLETDVSNALLLAAALDNRACGVQLPQKGATARLDFYCATRAEARIVLTEARALAPRGSLRAARIHLAARRDWAENWKRFFHTRRVSRRIVVKPSWEAYKPQPGEYVIELDPGLSFGTGLHGTTRACLRFLDKYQPKLPRASALDIGCGSGILAIAAAKLGFAHIDALDYDPEAVRIARANVAQNGVAGKVTIARADIAKCRRLKPRELVVANLMADLLINAADRISAAVSLAPDSVLILSGILRAQYAAVSAAFAARGFAEHAVITLGDWRTGCFQRGAVSRRTHCR